MSARRGVLDAGFTFAATLTIGLASAIVMSRIYGATVIGEFALVSAPWTMLNQFSNVGEQLALIRTLASESARSRRTTSTFLVVLAFSTVLTVAVALVVGPISVVLLRGPADQADLVAPAMLLLIAYVAVDNLSWNGDRLLIAIHRAPATFLVRVVQLLVLLVAAVAFAGDSPDVWGLTWATLVSCVFGFAGRGVLVLRSIDLNPRRADLREAVHELPQLLRFGIRVVPGGFAGGIAAPASTWLIGLTRSAQVLGAYSRASGLASRMQEASYRLGDILLPALSRWCTRGEHDVAAREFSRLRLVIMVTLAGGCAAVAGAAYGLLTVFGPDFTQASLALGLLVFAYALAIVAEMHHMFLLALLRPGTTSKLTLLRTGLTLTALVPLVLAFGTAGAGLAFLAGYSVEVTMSMRWCNRQLALAGASLDPLPWGRLGMATGAAIAAAWVVDTGLGGIIGGIVGALAGLVVFAAVGWSLRLVPGPEIARILGQQARLLAQGSGLPAGEPGPGGEGSASERPLLRVIYVLSRFPKVTETFVYEELHVLRKQLGMDIRVLAMVRMREDVVQPRAAELEDVVTYGSRSPWRLARGQLTWSCRRPLRLAGLWGRVLTGHLRSPGQLAKAVLTTLVACEWARTVRRSPPDHIHAHFATWGAHGAYVLSVLLDLPFSFTGHAHDLFGPNPMLEEKMAQAELVVVISEYERRLLAGQFPHLTDRLHVVRCGVDLDGFPPRPVAPMPGGVPILLCVASLTGYKGHPVLLQACAELRVRGHRFTCTLVGDGPERSALEASVRELGMADAVRFTGRLPAPQVRRLLQSSHLVVQPSVALPGGRMEGIPVSLMEAMATGRPVVASNLSGVPELVEDGVTGLLVPPDDAVALAAAVERLVEDPVLGQKLSRAGRERVECQYDVALNARHLADLLVGSSQPRESVQAPGRAGEGPRTSRVQSDRP